MPLDNLIPDSAYATEEYAAVQTYLNSPSPTTLSALTSPAITTTEPASADQVLKTLDHLWYALLLTACETPPALEPAAICSRETLVALTLALQAQPHLRTVPKYGQESGGETARVWADMPLFGMAVRETWNFSPDAATSVEEGRTWVALNAWLAGVTYAASLKGEDVRRVFDFADYGLWMLRDAFEEGVVGAETAMVGAAAVWVREAGGLLFKSSVEGREMSARTGVPGSRCVREGKAWRGFCMDRWRIWEEGLKMEATRNRPETRDLVKEALDKMTEWEKEI